MRTILKNAVWCCLITLVVSGLGACDVIEPNERRLANTGPVDTSNNDRVQKTILLEDVTGYRCNNCPEAAEIATQLQDRVYGKRLIVVGIHAGSFARILPADRGKAIDFQTPAGTEIATFFNVLSQPIGLVNRVVFQAQRLVTVGDWAAAIAAEAEKPARIDLSAQPEFNPLDSTLSVRISARFLEAGKASHRLVAYLVEDSIKGLQYDRRKDPQTIPDYYHRHVLRGTIGPGATWGENLASAAIPQNQTIERSYSLSFQGRTWRAEKSYVVAYVYDDDTKEIEQAVETKVLIK